MPTLDTEKYMKYMEGYDLTEAQKLEFINSLWGLAQNVVDKAFGRHPIQRHLQENKRERFTNEKRLSMVFMRWLYG